MVEAPLGVRPEGRNAFLFHDLFPGEFRFLECANVPEALSLDKLPSNPWQAMTCSVCRSQVTDLWPEPSPGEKRNEFAICSHCFMGWWVRDGGLGDSHSNPGLVLRLAMGLTAYEDREG